MGLAIGIDLGTTNSCAAIATPGGVEVALGPRGERVHPSVVAYPAAGGVLVGAEARARRVLEPTRTIYSAKRLIGQNVRSSLIQLAISTLAYEVEEGPNQQPVIVIGERRLTVPEVSARVLLHLRRVCEAQLGGEVNQAVITVPANFSDAQRRATHEAGRLGGLEVLRLINEPTAAALAYGFGERRDEIVCVYDFGGGTFDVSVLQIRGEIFEVLATDGDFFLGGDDLDRSVTEFLAQELGRSHGLDPRGEPGLMARLAIAAEEIKRHLSDYAVADGTIDGLVTERGEALSLPFRLDRAGLEGLIGGYVDRTIELCRAVLTTAGLDPSRISDVLCVGGSTRIPLVRRRIAELFGKEPLVRINPDEVVAQGAAIQAASLAGQLGDGRRRKTPTTLPPAFGDKPVPAGSRRPAALRPLLLDVAPATLGIATAGGYCERLIDKNAPIPIERTKVFTTARDDQTMVVIDCCRGEERRFEDNEPLGQLVLPDLPARPRGDVKIEVTLRVDTDGILHVRARDAATGAAREVTLTVIGAPAAGGPAA